LCASAAKGARNEDLTAVSVMKLSGFRTRCRQNCKHAPVTSVVSLARIEEFVDGAPNGVFEVEPV
jgi:hypothetical protein